MLSSQNMGGFDHATTLSPSFHGLRKECLAQWSRATFCVPKKRPKIPGGYFQKNWEGVCSTLPEPLPYFRPKSVIFPTLFQTWSPEARRVTGGRDKLLRHVHGSWRKHYKGNGLIPPNDEEEANSFKKHTQFKTIVDEPYPISAQNGRNWYPISDQNG